MDRVGVKHTELLLDSVDQERNGSDREGVKNSRKSFLGLLFDFRARPVEDEHENDSD